MLQVHSIDFLRISSDFGSFASHHSDTSTTLTNRSRMCCAQELVSISRAQEARHLLWNVYIRWSLLPCRSALSRQLWPTSWDTMGIIQHWIMSESLAFIFFWHDWKEVIIQFYHWFCLINFYSCCSLYASEFHLKQNTI